MSSRAFAAGLAESAVIVMKETMAMRRFAQRKVWYCFCMLPFAKKGKRVLDRGIVMVSKEVGFHVVVGLP